MTLVWWGGGGGGGGVAIQFFSTKKKRGWLKTMENIKAQDSPAGKFVHSKSGYQNLVIRGAVYTFQQQNCLLIFF